MGQLLNTGLWGNRRDVKWIQDLIKDKYRELNLFSPVLFAQQHQGLVWSIRMDIPLSVKAMGCCSSWRRCRRTPISTQLSYTVVEAWTPFSSGVQSKGSCGWSRCMISSKLGFISAWLRIRKEVNEMISHANVHEECERRKKKLFPSTSPPTPYPPSQKNTHSLFTFNPLFFKAVRQPCYDEVIKSLLWS